MACKGKGSKSSKGGCKTKKVAAARSKPKRRDNNV